jgi:hypothetical protein
VFIQQLIFHFSADHLKFIHNLLGIRVQILVFGNMLQILNDLLNNGKLLGENLKNWHFLGKSINIIISRMEK